VTLIGRTNTGKSTLLNALIGRKVTIVSSIAQTTRYLVRGILDLPGAQIVFVDTPGISLVKKGFGSKMNARARSAVEGVDLIYYLADVQRPPQEEEKNILRFLGRESRIPVIMILNKMDRGTGYLDEYLRLVKEDAEASRTIKYYIPLSALTRKNLDELIQATLRLLPGGERFYPEGTTTDFPLEFRIADIVREKFFQRVTQEIPYAIAVVTENIEDKGSVIYVQVSIYVNSLSQKKIVIGSKGGLIKAVSVASREEIEPFLGKKVFLDLWVKVMADWQDSPRILRETGYEE
jgi:GTP-binding protein Era